MTLTYGNPLTVDLARECLSQSIVGITLFYRFVKNKNKQHRYFIYSRDDFTCVTCKRFFEPPKDWDKKSAIHDGTMYLDIDHIIPVSKGGSDNIDNKQAMCQKCNNIKSDTI